MIPSERLQAYSLFGGLTPDQVDIVRACMRVETFEPGQTLMKEGEPNDSIFFILEGSVEVRRHGTFIVELPEGQTVGEMELLDVMPAVATVVAVGALKVAAISNSCVRSVYASDPKAFGLMMMNLARDLSRRLRRMDELTCDEVGRGSLDEKAARKVKPVFG